MDTSDPEISFDAEGRCNHCNNALARLEQSYHPDERGRAELEALLARIRKAGEGRPYDCMIGLSGGVDSSFLAYKAKDWGLRPLVFHVDAGWDSETAQKNIECLVKTLGYNLYTYVVDWEEMKDLQRAYFEAALANQDVPQDHVFFAVLFKKAPEMGITCWLSGYNLVSESILPTSWGYSAMDGRQLRAVHRRFGRVPLKSYLTLNFFEYIRCYGELRLLSSIQTAAPLNLLPYDVGEAKEELARQTGWQSYGRKHGESRFTKFFQNHYLPVKFGYDKRRAHLSSLIAAGQITREGALLELEKPLYEENEMKDDKAFVLKKLDYSTADWERIMRLPNRTYRDYPNWASLMTLGRSVKRQLRRTGVIR